MSLVVVELGFKVYLRRCERLRPKFVKVFWVPQWGFLATTGEVMNLPDSFLGPAGLTMLLIFLEDFYSGSNVESLKWAGKDSSVRLFSASILLAISTKRSLLTPPGKSKIQAILLTTPQLSHRLLV